MTSTLYKGAAEVPTSAVDVCSCRGAVEVLDQLSDEWQELCKEAADDQPLYRPEWIRAYLRCFAPRAKLMLIAARIGGRLLLVLPLLEERRTFSKVPVRTFRSPVDSYAGRFDAIYSAGPEGEAAIRATWRYLRDLNGWDLLQLRNALQGSAMSRLASAAAADGLPTMQIDGRPSPYVPVPTDPELRKQLPVNARLRRELRSVRRQLAEQGSTLKFYRLETADRNALNRFYELEASGWKGRERTAILFHGARPLFDEVAEAASRLGYFTLYMLELNGKLIAAHYGFTHRACYYSVKVAYDENFRELSPGHLIIGEIVNDCAARGIQTFDTGGEDQEWKMKWTNHTQPLSQHYVFRGPLGYLAYTVATRLRPKIGLLLTKEAESVSVTAAVSG